MRIAVATLGCKVNQYESAQLAYELSQSFKVIDFKSKADVYVINTCAVTAEAEHKSRKLIAQAKRSNPEAKIIVTGCYGELATEKLRLSGASLIVGNNEKQDLAAIIYDLKKIKQPKLPGQPVPAANRSRAVVKVQDGCDQFCTYCVIPYLRGTLSSKHPESVISEIKSLALSGFNEVVLTGIHLGKYGYDLNQSLNLTTLLTRLLNETTIRRIRLSSIEPLEITDDLIDLIAESDRLARHLHVPLQSANDEILTAMNRPYKSEEFLRLVDKIREKVPETAITTDILVGFPGETENQFRDTARLAKQINFRKIHVFKYSDRPMIPAAKYPNKISVAVKSERAAEILKISLQSAGKFAKSYVGKVLEIVSEKSDGGWRQGLSSNYLKVRFKNPPVPPGFLLRVEITKAENDILYGIAENQSSTADEASYSR